MTDPARGRVEFRVRYAETDQMGRAHHGHYLAWCELGRTALMRDRGIPYGDLERGGVLLPVTRAELEYRRGARFDDLVSVETVVEWVRSRAVAFRYRIARIEDEALLARVRTELVCTDQTGRPRRLPEAVRTVLESGTDAVVAGNRGRDGRDPAPS